MPVGDRIIFFAEVDCSDTQDAPHTDFDMKDNDKTPYLPRQKECTKKQVELKAAIQCKSNPWDNTRGPRKKDTKMIVIKFVETKKFRPI